MTTLREPSVILRPIDETDSFVDGAWRPQSLDLVAELPALLAEVEAAGYPEVRRVSYALAGWDAPTDRNNRMLDRVVKLGGFRSQDVAEIGLIDSSGWKRVTLVVLPPGSEPAMARRVMEMAGTTGDRHHAREILDLAVDDSPRSGEIQERRDR